MRAPYERPVIQKLHTGQMNKFGGSPYYARKVRDAIEKVPVADLVERFGSPLFVFSEATLRRRFREVRDAFTTRYPNVVFGWSYKTNYLSAICAVCHQEGALAEVVSEMEYDKARALGVPGSNIIYNGPHKSRASLEKAVREGAQIHVDHLDEVADLEALAIKLGREIRIGLRLNLDTGIQPQWSRFGLNLDSGQAFDVAKRIRMGRRLVIAGLHCHIGTYIMKPEAYGVAVEKLVKFGYRLKDDLGFDIEYLDLGGGFPSKSRLKGSYMPPEIALEPIDIYAEKISDALFASLRQGDFPRLILETGRAIVDEAGYLIATIGACKRMPDGRRAYVLDAGINLLYTAAWYKFTVEIEREVQGANEPTVLYGPLCMNIDVVDEGLLLPPLTRGTRLILSPVGAYSVTQWMQFIEYRPAVVMIGTDGMVDVIREAEDLTDILRRERLPERLKLAT
ncbi:diaminopimelate decarboxylase [uncultured Gammaproteobacteria bacterium]